MFSGKYFVWFSSFLRDLKLNVRVYPSAFSSRIRVSYSSARRKEDIVALILIDFTKNY